MPTQDILQLRHIPAAENRGCLRLSAWLVNRPSRQVRREWRRREPLSPLIPPPHPPPSAGKRRKTCDTRRRHRVEREFAARAGGVRMGTGLQPSLPFAACACADPSDGQHPASLPRSPARGSACREADGFVHLANQAKPVARPTARAPLRPAPHSDPAGSDGPNAVCRRTASSPPCCPVSRPARRERPHGVPCPQPGRAG